MGTQLKELTDYLESIAPIQLQESYDNSGLITGHHLMEIKGVLLSLDVTEQVLEECLEKDCNVLVVHHPIWFRPLRKLNGYHYVERCVIKAIKSDIAIYAIHTNLDNVLRNGVNEEIAKRLELDSVSILRRKEGFR